MLKKNIFFLAILLMIVVLALLLKLSLANLNKKGDIRKEIIGNWGALNKRPYFRFSSDSIYYYKDSISHYYTLSEDTLKVHFKNRDTGTVFGKVKVINDTLFICQFYQDNFTVKAYRSSPPLSGKH